jgi:hypothetical protein
MLMNVHMSFLRWSRRFRAILVDDGWVISTEKSQDELDATHPEVGDQDAARIRLYRLGLLISHSLHIDFFPRARKVSTDTWNSHQFLDGNGSDPRP